MTRILGIDPGLGHTGWGVIEYVNNTPKHLANGTITTDMKAPLAERLAKIAIELERVIEVWNPAEAAVEETFVNSNPMSALKLGQARGVALCAPARFGIKTAEYAATKIKKTIVGAGHAGKGQIQLMVAMLMPRVELDSADSADALAIAICHAHHRVSDRLKITEMV